MPRLYTWILALLPALGVGLVLVGVGVFGGLPEKSADTPDAWWDRGGFVVNLASGVTGACFGIPVAFFILRRLISEVEDAESHSKTSSKYEESIRLISHDLLVCVGGSESIRTIETLVSMLFSIRVHAARNVGEPVVVPHETTQVTTSGGSVIAGGPFVRTSGPLESLDARLQELYETGREARETWSDVPHVHVARIRRRWEYVVSELIPRAESTGTALMSYEETDEIDSLVAKLTHLHHFSTLMWQYGQRSTLHDDLVTPWYQSPDAEAIATFVREFTQYCDDAQKELSTFLILHGQLDAMVSHDAKR